MARTRYSRDSNDVPTGPSAGSGFNMARTG